MDNDAWMAKALSKIETYPPDTVFEVKQLFDSVEWEELKPGERSGFGRHFASQYNSGKIPNVERLERAKNNHSRYRKL